ncbi:hypothetical protein [Rhodoferax mekongensis]|uniref:hypothetical protein n=1 Tax=Rhodoferax mekongensis TaxID=3068341 RepID=UPI0028BF5743|nr:hypothetical protein [Rhodoferax sp. TBRC 17199]MDT7514549.1 hypothetical protein [Rhodoferax sp. TBRC 17199]
MSFGISAGTAMAGASLVSGFLGADASRRAASQQADAAARATEAQAAALAQQREDLQPWVVPGKLANNKLSQMLGLDGTSSFTSDDPSYAFRFNEGQKAVDNGAASRGMSLSGGALKALQKYGQGMASTEFQNSFNRYKSVSDSGQNAAAGQGAATMNFGNSKASNLLEAGNAEAAGTMGTANALSGALGGFVNNYQQNQMLDLYAQKNKLGKYAG